MTAQKSPLMESLDDLYRLSFPVTLSTMEAAEDTATWAKTLAGEADRAAARAKNPPVEYTEWVKYADQASIKRAHTDWAMLGTDQAYRLIGMTNTAVLVKRIAETASELATKIKALGFPEYTYAFKAATESWVKASEYADTAAVELDKYTNRTSYPDLVDASKIAVEATAKMAEEAALAAMIFEKVITGLADLID